MESSVIAYLKEKSVSVEKKNDHYLLTYKGLSLGRYYPNENKMTTTRLPPVGEYFQAQDALRACREKFHCKIEV